MRAVKAKRLRKEASRITRQQKQRVELAPGGGVSRYVLGFDRTYHDLKRAARSRRSA